MANTLSSMAPLGTAAPPFTLPNAHGAAGAARVGRDDFRGRPWLAVFMCNHCPFVLHIAAALARFGADYQPRGLGMVGINANDAEAYPDDAPQRMGPHAKAMGYTFPYLHDATQEVARAYGAVCTPDFFLFDAGHHLAYRGQFDPSRPGSATAATGEALRAAADAVLAGRPAPTPQLPSIGCSIKWRAAAPR